MDAETRAKQLAELTRELTATYTLIIDLMARLPAPILLLRNQAADPEWAIHSLSRTWEILGTGALPELLLLTPTRDMITSWLTAYEITTLAAGPAGPADWRLRSIDANLQRVRGCAGHLDREFTALRW